MTEPARLLTQVGEWMVVGIEPDFMPGVENFAAYVALLQRDLALD